MKKEDVEKLKELLNKMVLDYSKDQEKEKTGLNSSLEKMNKLAEVLYWLDLYDCCNIFVGVMNSLLQKIDDEDKFVKYTNELFDILAGMKSKVLKDREIMRNL